MRVTFFLLVAVLLGPSALGQVSPTNLVGYVNCVYAKGYRLIANPLEQGVGNPLDLVMKQVPEGTRIVKLLSQGWLTNEFVGGTWMYPQMSLSPGEGAVLWSPEEWVHTWVGQLKEGEIVVEVPEGSSLLANPIPRAGRLTTDLQFPKVSGTLVYGVDGATGEFLLRGTCTEAGWEPADPVVDVGEGFYVVAPISFLWRQQLILELSLTGGDTGVLLTPKGALSSGGVLEVSSDLETWTELQDVENVGGEATIDRFAAGRTARFYRYRVD